VDGLLPQEAVRVREEIESDSVGGGPKIGLKNPVFELVAAVEEPVVFTDVTVA
jgi:hypothetical protein